MILPKHLLTLALSAGILSFPVSAGPVRSFEDVVEAGLFTRSTTDVGYELSPEIQARAVKLVPLREEELFPHLKKRSDDYSTLRLRNQVRMIFGGRSAESDDHHLADLKISQPDPRHPMILLEAFDHHTNDISCSGKYLKLTFSNKNALESAVHSWDWVNENENDFFYIVTHHHHKGCGPDEERAPYKIMEVKYDTTKFTAILTRVPVSWDEAAPAFKLKIGGVSDPLTDVSPPSPGQKRISKRSGTDSWTWDADEVLGSVARTGVEILRGLANEFDKAGSMAYDLTVTDKDLYEKKRGGSKPGNSLVCEDCGVKGKLKVLAWAERKNGQEKVDFGIGIKPNAEAALKLKASLALDIAKDHTPDLIAIPLMPAALTIPVIGTLGLELVLTPGVEGSASLKGSITTDFKWESKDGILLATYKDEGMSLKRGSWRNNNAEFSFKPSVGLTVEGKIDAYMKLGLRAGLILMQGTKNLSAFIGIKGLVETSVNAGFRSGGFCPDDKDSKGDWGIEFKADYGVEAGIDFENDLLPEAISEIVEGFTIETKADIVEKKPIFDAKTCFAVNADT
ncbi:hypothetical protein H072_4116 [Dactylellina haptotyla CBS 200.50]|uniref:DUF7029 domain-containing protein n=1 Tax=Dactylellina haptotyla (strain CBS 200.50) TaxID=1284197 RepID=S8C2P7_DACHA|nr:hypothetical protein H072_4116 [Dactylellina haptotyla CBS 200.50]